MQEKDIPREEYYRVKAEAEELMQRLIKAHAKIEALQSGSAAEVSSDGGLKPGQTQQTDQLQQQERLFIDTSPLVARFKKMQAQQQVRIQQLEAELKAAKAEKSWLRTTSFQALREAYRSRKYKQQLREQVKLLKASDYFDTDWYLDQYSDVASSRLDPIIHYLKTGALEGRNPSKQFDTLYYIHQYPDVAEAGLNPLVHFVVYGIKEGRRPQAHQNLLPSL